MVTAWNEDHQRRCQAAGKAAQLLQSACSKAVHEIWPLKLDFWGKSKGKPGKTWMVWLVPSAEKPRKLVAGDSTFKPPTLVPLCNVSLLLTSDGPTSGKHSAKPQTNWDRVALWSFQRHMYRPQPCDSTLSHLEPETGSRISPWHPGPSLSICRFAQLGGSLSQDATGPYFVDN